MDQQFRTRSKAVLIYFVVSLMIFSFATVASATNGYFSHGYSVKNKALGGAGTALPLDSLAASTNPAGMAFVGSRVDLGLSLFNPNREYTVTGGPTPPPPGCELTGTCPFGLKTGTFESDSKWFVIPYFGVNKMLNDKSSLGLSVYGNGGMNTDYDEATFYAEKPTGVDLMQLFIAPTYAMKLHSNHAFGVSAIGAYQLFETQGLGSFSMLSQNPRRLTDNGHEDAFGFGGRIGYYGKILHGLYIGASYQTKIYMSRFNDYKGLFAEDGDFDIPANWSAGIAYQPIDPLTLVFDVQQIYYSDVDSVGNTFNPAFTNCSSGRASYCLGGKNGIGFGWDDMTIYKFGVQWQSNSSWTWRAGYSIGEQPIPDSEVLFNIIAPGVIEQHITAGLSKTIGNNQELNVTVMHALSNDVSGKNPLDPAQTIELKMDQWEITAGYSWKF